MIDRAPHLKSLDDVWPEVRKHLDGFMFDEADLEAKFRKGEREHGRDWLHMTREQLEVEIQNELKDMLIYRAMICARFDDEGTAPAFFTNRDPGDEGPEYAVPV